MRDYLAEAEDHLTRSREAMNAIEREESETAARTTVAVGSLEALQSIAASLENISARAFPPAFAPGPGIVPGPVTSSADEDAGKHAAREIWGLLGGPEGVL